MLRILAILLGGALLVVAFISTMQREARGPFVPLSPPVPQNEPLRKLWQIPDFTLTERTGRPVSLAEFKGKVWVADFFYSACPGPCPMLSSRLRDIHAALGSEPDVRLVSISTDPERDTPEVLRAYAKRFHADARWLFLTGDKAQIFDLANKGFKVSVTENPGGIPEPVTHSTKLILIDRTGTARGIYEGVGEEGPERILRDIRRLLAEPS